MLTFFCELALPIQIGIISVTCLVAFKLYIISSSGTCVSKNQLPGKTVIITGANTGIGLETAIDLAQRGARIILACRNVQKGNVARDEIVKQSGNENVAVRELDLASLASVRKFSAGILETESRLDILINNAGCATPVVRKLTEDGLEYTMQSNYFGHFLLTNLLLGLLKKTAPSRVINVSSLAHALANNLDCSNLNFETGYDGKVYHTSKLCQIISSHYLAPLIIDSGVTVNNLHPGIVQTEILRNETFYHKFLKYFLFPLFKNAKSGAQTTIYLAIADEVAGVTGEYFSDCKLTKTKKSAKDDGLAKKLWEVSESLVKLNPEDRQF